MSLTEVSSTAAIRTPTPAPVPPPQPVEPPSRVAQPLEPAVRVDIRSGERPVAVVPRPADAAPKERRITVDEDTKSLVYQVVDPNSGDVVVQLPDPTVLKARAYAEALEVKTQAAERPLDRTA